MNSEPTAVASPATLEALDLGALLAMLASLAATDLGRARLTALRPTADAGELEERRRSYAEAARLLADGGALVPAFEEGLADLLDELEGERGELDGVELVTLAAVAGAAAGAAERLLAGDAGGSLARRAGELPDLAGWRQRVRRALDSRGRVRDDASPELARMRRRIQSLRESLYGELRQTVQAQRDLFSEETVPLHDGRLVLLLQSGARGRMPGLVHGRSGTGRSLYFEPLAAVEGNNRLQETVADEQAERQRIVNDLVAEARADAPAFARLFDFLAELDALQAAWSFAGRCEGRLAELAESSELILAAAHHPLLDPRLAPLRLAALGSEGHTGVSVPVDLDLGSERRLVVVTGPNAGGKTVTLKVVGLAVLAHQCGLPVPAAAGTRLPVVERLMAAVGDEQDLLHDRSTFSGRLLRLREAWEAAGPRSLVLVDELGSGTDPEEGAALAVALLESLLEAGGLGLLTTHLTPLAAAALEREGAWCAAMEFDPESGEPTFRLRPGAPGGSEALSLARRLGLPAAWIDRAEELLGAEHRELRKLLGEVEAVRGELARAEADARQEADRLRAERRAAEEERAALTEKRRKLEPRLRAELEAFRRQVGERLRDELETMRAAVAGGRRKGLAAAASERLFAEAPLAEREPAAAGPLGVGGRVRHRGLGWEGELRELGEESAEVVVSGKRLRCSPADLVPLGDAGAAGRPAAGGRAAGRAAEPEGPAPPPELKLIGQRVEPALDELDRYLDRALLAGLTRVRVVHGHGSGRLREAVREHLSGHPVVASHRPGRKNEGGDGATVVTLA